MYSTKYCSTQSQESKSGVRTHCHNKKPVDQFSEVWSDIQCNNPIYLNQIEGDHKIGWLVPYIEVKIWLELSLEFSEV